MRKTTKSENNNKLAVDVITLAQMLECGTQTARQIGEDAGATIRIGRRVLFNVQRVQEYLDSISA
ncbi:MAG: hypothetical protein IJI78_09575 [Oscillospiraceae bacterium]|nr:hypothetical protein [Oscillospiraceae bacterium]